MISSVLLAIDNPNLNPESFHFKIIKYLDIFFAFSFIIEALLKILSIGFIFNSEDNSKSYIRNYWNILDFVIVITYILDIFTESNNFFRYLKSIRALRALRPLRVLSRNEYLKILINDFLQTILPLINLILVVGIFAIPISIITMYEWKGKFYFCSHKDKYGDQLIRNNSIITN